MIFSKIFIEYYLWENFWNVATKEANPPVSDAARFMAPGASNHSDRS